MGYWAKIAGYIVLAYIVFTTINGNLRGWLRILGLKPDTLQAGEIGLKGTTAAPTN